MSDNDPTMRSIPKETPPSPPTAGGPPRLPATEVAWPTAGVLQPIKMPFSHFGNFPRWHQLHNPTRCLCLHASAVKCYLCLWVSLSLSLSACCSFTLGQGDRVAIYGPLCEPRGTLPLSNRYHKNAIRALSNFVKTSIKTKLGDTE